MITDNEVEGLPVRRPYWLIREWWQYVTDDSRCPDKSHGDDEIFNGRWWWWLADKWQGPIQLVAYLFRCQCRARGHPYGVVWFNVGGTEPDQHCYGCGEDLG
jgi:hypothetical protein